MTVMNQERGEFRFSQEDKPDKLWQQEDQTE